MVFDCCSGIPPCIPPNVPLQLRDTSDVEGPFISQLCPCAIDVTPSCRRTTPSGSSSRPHL